MVSNDDIVLAPTRFKKILVEHSADIPISTTITKIFTPEIGHIWSVSSMFLDANANYSATTGSHYFEINEGITHPKIKGVSNYNSHLRWWYNMWLPADHSQFPSTEIGALITLQNLGADHDNPLYISYRNNTDAIQTATIIFGLTVKETLY